MRVVDIITMALLIVGGFNWGFVGLYGLDLVATIFGAGSLLARLVYVLVAASAVWQIQSLLQIARAEPAGQTGSSRA